MTTISVHVPISAERYNVNNARNFNGNNGNLNNNNVYNSYIAQAVLNLPNLILRRMNLETIFTHYIRIYFATRRNKRYGKDAMEFEANWVPLLVGLMYEHLTRTFRIRHNYAFLVSSPRWREIFATEFAGRLADHEICDALAPYIEETLSPRTYNNRKGKGAQAAINQVIEDMCEVSDGYTRKSWIIKLDLKGYFPNASWDFAEKCLLDVLERNRDDIAKRRGREYPDYLRWLIMVCVHANPAAHYEPKTPRRFWDMHISPEKSIITKPEGVGAAIGRLLWQTAMGLYINDEIKWLSEQKGVRVVCFVDDLVLQVRDEYKSYALECIPTLRRMFSSKHVCLNEKKFYCQPYWHGLEFLGSHIKPYRVHLNNTTFANALSKIDELNKFPNKYVHLDHFVSSINSYTGVLKNRNEYKRLRILRSRISRRWFAWLFWDEGRQCIAFKQNHDLRHRMNKKYKLRLKFKNNDKPRKKKPVVHRTTES